MSVTREVSQLEMSALKLGMLTKRYCMLFTSETHQSAMEPYFAMAAAAFESNSVTAVFREPLLVKVLRPVQADWLVGGGDGDGGGGLGLVGGDGDGGEGLGGGGDGDGGGGLGLVVKDMMSWISFSWQALPLISTRALCSPVKGYRQSYAPQ